MTDDIRAFPPSASAPTKIELDFSWDQSRNDVIPIEDANFEQYFRNYTYRGYVRVVATEKMKQKRLQKLWEGDIFARDEKGQEGREDQTGVLMDITGSRFLDRLMFMVFPGQPMGTVCFVDDSDAEDVKMEYEDISLERLRKVDKNMEKEEFEYFQDCYLLCSLAKTFEEDENVNMYDLSALEEEETCPGRRREKVYEFSAVLCAVMQIVFPLAVGIFVTDKMIRDPGRQFCPITTGWERDQILTRILNKITGVISVLYLILYLIVQEKQWKEKPTLAMLEIGRMAKVINDPKWIVLGRTMTVLNLASCGLASLMVIYEAEDPLELVLNSLALFFVAEVDELLVRRRDILRSVRMVKESIRKLVKPFPALKEKKKTHMNRFKSAMRSAANRIPDKNEEEVLHDLIEFSKLHTQSEPVTNDTNTAAAFAPGSRSESAPKASTQTTGNESQSIIHGNRSNDARLLADFLPKVDSKYKISDTYELHIGKWLMTVGNIVFYTVNIVLILSPIYIVVCK